MKILLLNIIAFQIGWFVCVTMGNTAAVIYTALALILHKVRVVRYQSEWTVIAIVASIGSLWDWAMIANGVLVFGGSDVTPIWLVCLWLLFSTTLSHSLYWIRRYLPLAVVLGAVFGPLSYWLGAKISQQTQVAEPLLQSLLIIALGWCVLLPMGLLMAGRMNR